MTSDEWRRVEPVLTSALGRPTAEQQRAIAEAFLHDTLERRLLEVLRRTNLTLTGLALPDTDASESTVPPPPGRPTLAANDAVADGRFRIVRQLGRGGMADVYLATDTKLETLVALKVMLAGHTREAQHARRCSGHPHIVTIYDVFETTVHGQQVTVLVMEHVPGKNLDLLIDDGEIDLVNAVRWTRQAVSALAHAHDSTVLHCDLKPANILATPEGAKVVDFGIGRATFERVEPGAPIHGTLPYMAPEQLESKEFSRAGDIYAAGVTLFKLVTGRLPFEGRGSELVMRIIGAPAPRLGAFRPGVPRELEDVVACAMAKDPVLRYASARQLEKALERVENNLHARVQPLPSPWSKVGVVAVTLAGIFGVLIALGALTSSIYNMTLERSGFVSEGLSDWLLWGRRTLFAQLFGIVLYSVLAAPFILGRRILIATMPPARRLDDRAADTLRLWGQQLGLDHLPVCASLALVLSCVALTAAVFYYSPLIQAVLDFVSRAPGERLALLAAANTPSHNAYRYSFVLVNVFCALVWYPVLKRASGGEHLHPAFWTAAGTVLLATFVMLHFPYRLMNYRTSYTVASWNGQHCYVTGERADAVLLFCPDFPSNRNHEVKRTDPALTITTAKETNLFNRFVEPRTAGRDAGK